MSDERNLTEQTIQLRKELEAGGFSYEDATRMAHDFFLGALKGEF